MLFMLAVHANKLIPVSHVLMDYKNIVIVRMSEMAVIEVKV